MLHKRGYDVQTQDATVDNLTKISGDGVFHISTHGGTEKARDGKDYWAMFTSTPVNDTNDANYKLDLDSARLIYFTAANGYTALVFKHYETHYAITGNFITHYKWSFAPNCVAFLNFCYSNQSGFAQSVIDQGATVAAGWSNAADPEKAWKSARYFFDRLLGTNMEPPLETGKQRPFNLAVVVPDMEAKGVTDASTTRFGTSKLVVVGTADTILAPSIQTMDIQERFFENPLKGQNKLTINGLFGDGMQPTVTVGGANVTVVDFSPTVIHCHIADKPDQPGYSGNVIVKTDVGITGNAVPITTWQGDFIYSTTIFPASSGILITSIMTTHAYLRADVHEYRTKPAETLLKQGAKVFRATMGSGMHFETAGGPPPGTTWTRHSADYVYGLNGTVPDKYGSGFILEGTFNPKSGTVPLAFNFLGSVATWTLGKVSQDLAPIHDPKILASPIGVDHTNGATIFAPQVLASLDGDYSIKEADFVGDTTALFNTHFTLQHLTPTDGPTPKSGEDYGP
jgi:hypothetical protein